MTPFGSRGASEEREVKLKNKSGPCNIVFMASKFVHIRGPHTVEYTINLTIQMLKALGDKFSLLGRTTDLKSAYRQLPVADKSTWCSILAVFRPFDIDKAHGPGKVEYYLGCRLGNSVQSLL